MVHTVSKRKRALVNAKTGGYCFYCGEDLADGRMTVDHIIPRSKGGHKSKASNLVPCCYDCNQKKANLSVEEFRQTLDRKTFYGERTNAKF